MELVKVVCTTCGNNLDATEDRGAITCEYCGNTFLMSNGLDFALRSEEEIGSIKKIRNNLQRAVVADDHKNILAFSKEVLRLIPKDDLANYYFAYANYSFGSRKYLFDFYEHIVIIPIEANTIIEHIIDYSDVRDKALIEAFIARNNPDKLESYRDKYTRKLVEEENYSSIPRDIFVSFRSTEIEIATEVLETIEKDGSSCWISSRNLRPNDNENYWTNIEDAITKCKIFLVISSHDAMISRDVKKELDIATKLNKTRIEFKVDTSRHTSLFKYFFDGLKWIDATSEKEDALVELKRRVYSMLSDANQFKTKAKSIKQTYSDDFVRKINRSKVELLSNNYPEAVNSIKDALGINPESSEAWWMLFIAENQFQSTETFTEYVSKKQTLSKMADLYNKVSYKQYKKHSEKTSDGLPPNAKMFEKYLYDDIISYLNKKNLPSKSKRDYLNSYLPNHILTIWSNIFLVRGLDTDEEVQELLEDPKRIKELENTFENFEDIKNHPSYDKSHLKEYYERFYGNYEKVLKKRETNLQELQKETNDWYTTIEQLISKKKFKDAYEQAQELFYIDNSCNDKYMFLLMAKLKAKTTIELYDSILKLKKQERVKLFNSVVYEKLYRSEKYSHLMNDIVLHATYKKRRKNDRILIDVRGEDNEV